MRQASRAPERGRGRGREGPSWTSLSGALCSFGAALRGGIAHVHVLPGTRPPACCGRSCLLIEVGCCA